MQNKLFQEMAYHARSNSLPSRPNAIVPQAEECLCRLRSSGAASTSRSLSQKLNSLQELHDCVDELLLLPLTRQAIARESIDELLDGSVKLLDGCNIIKEALLQIRASAQEIQSILRRRCDANVMNEMNKFMSTRKAVKKAIQKALKNLKGVGSIHSPIAMLGEAQAHVVVAFESSLYFINRKKARSSSRSLVSTIRRSKRVASEAEEENEFAKVDVAVQCFVDGKVSAENNVQKQLKELDLCIQDLEDGVESLFRRLIKTRVSLLNIINH